MLTGRKFFCDNVLGSVWPADNVKYDKNYIKDVYELYWLKHYKGFKYLKCLIGFTYLTGLGLLTGLSTIIRNICG